VQVTPSAYGVDMTVSHSLLSSLSMCTDEIVQTHFFWQ
jgi:hypothetical protein